ncbi:MAG: hypothetical protein A2451_03075 [Bdellovibrionales bacterium RIFOXYC2_FULL_39_8]|nr:MAG: hypothetical protein A2451_03075 [Bdellovibrionales bacterium RIFOXYC2_FULL_39_8]
MIGLKRNHKSNIKNLGHARYFSTFVILLRKDRLSAQDLLSANVPEHKPLTREWQFCLFFT